MKTESSDLRSGDSSVSKRTSRRKRSSKACHLCRTRKVKCDVITRQPCSNCVAFNCDCVVPEKRKYAVRERYSNLNHENNSAGSRSTSSSTSTSTGTSNQTINGNISSPASSLPNTPFKKPSFVIEDLQSKYPILSEVPLDPNTVLKEQCNLITSEYFGSVKKSGLLSQGLSNYVEKVFSKEGRRLYLLDTNEYSFLEQSGCFMLPNFEFVNKMITSYFENSHPILPIINRTKFVREYQNLTDPPSLLLLHTVMLNGLRNMDTPDWSDQQLDEQAEMCKVLFRRVKALLNSGVEGDPVVLCQVYLILCDYSERNTVHTSSPFYYIARAINIAQAYGMHRDQSINDSLNDAQRRIYKRIFWSLYVKDRINVSMAYGRPTIINVNDCDIEILTEDDFIEDEPGYPTVPEYKISQLSIDFVITLCKISELLDVIRLFQSDINRRLRNKLPILEEMRKSDLILTKFWEGLPSSLKFRINDDTCNSQQSALISMYYYILLIYVHRVNIIDRHRIGPSSPSWGITFKSSYVVIMTCQYLVSQNKTDGFMCYCLLMSGTILLFHLQNKDPKIAEFSYKAVERCICILRSISFKWKLALSMLSILENTLTDKNGQEMIRNSHAIHTLPISRGKDAPGYMKSRESPNLEEEFDNTNKDDNVSPQESHHEKSQVRIPLPQPAEVSQQQEQQEQQEQQQQQQQPQQSQEPSNIYPQYPPNPNLDSQFQGQIFMQQNPENRLPTQGNPQQLFHPQIQSQKQFQQSTQQQQQGFYPYDPNNQFQTTYPHQGPLNINAFSQHAQMNVPVMGEPQNQTSTYNIAADPNAKVSFPLPPQLSDSSTSNQQANFGAAPFFIQTPSSGVFNIKEDPGQIFDEFFNQWNNIELSAQSSKDSRDSFENNSSTLKKKVRGTKFESGDDIKKEIHFGSSSNTSISPSSSIASSNSSTINANNTNANNIAAGSHLAMSSTQGIPVDSRNMEFSELNLDREIVNNCSLLREIRSSNWMPNFNIGNIPASVSIEQQKQQPMQPVQQQQSPQPLPQPQQNADQPLHSDLKYFGFHALEHRSRSYLNDVNEQFQLLQSQQAQQQQQQQVQQQQMMMMMMTMHQDGQQPVMNYGMMPNASNNSTNLSSNLDELSINEF